MWLYCDVFSAVSKESTCHTIQVSSTRTTLMSMVDMLMLTGREEDLVAEVVVDSVAGHRWVDLVEG